MLQASITDREQSRLCFRCKHAFEKDQTTWTMVQRSGTQEVVWCCQNCTSELQKKPTTRRVNPPQNSIASQNYDIPPIHKAVAAAQRGQVGAAPVQAISTPASHPAEHYSHGALVGRSQPAHWHSGPMVATGTEASYPASIMGFNSGPGANAVGYTPAHAQFGVHQMGWQKKALSTGGDVVQQTIPIRFYMGRVEQGKPVVKMIADLMEGATVDAHIGAADLHRLCYEKLQPLWSRWSGGYELPLLRTKLCLPSRFARIQPPTVGLDRDAIYELCLVKKGRSTTPRFDAAKEITLQVVIQAAEDYERAYARHCETWLLNPEDENSIASVPSNQNRPMLIQPTFKTIESGESVRAASIDAGARRGGSPSVEDDWRLSPPPIDDRAEQQLPADVASHSSAVPGATKGNKDESVSKRVRSDSYESSANPPVQPATKKVVHEREYLFHAPDIIARALSQQTPLTRDELGSTLGKKRYTTVDYYLIPELDFNDLVSSMARLTLDDERIKAFRGELEVTLGQTVGEQGAFKTAHVGRVTLELYERRHDGVDIFTQGDVCVKQAYVSRDGKVARYPGSTELGELWMESVCLIWAAALLDHAYGWMDQQRSQMVRTSPEYTHALAVPQMRFVRFMIAIARLGEKDKVFLIEEFIDEVHTGGFVKYNHNTAPRPIEGLTHDQLVRAEFLCFVQHLQYIMSGGQVFTADFQGGDILLTDPQLITAPELGKQLFGNGNVTNAHTSFPTAHVCNDFCALFKLDPLRCTAPQNVESPAPTAQPLQSSQPQVPSMPVNPPAHQSAGQPGPSQASNTVRQRLRPRPSRPA